MGQPSIDQIAGNTIEDFTLHELAHVLTFQNCDTIKQMEVLSNLLYNEWVFGVSGYKMDARDGTETIAEAFVLRYTGIKVNARADKLLNRYIEAHRK